MINIHNITKHFLGLFIVNQILKQLFLYIFSGVEVGFGAGYFI